MSNLPKNYEKILIGVAAVAALGFGAWGYLSYSSATADLAYTPKGSGGGNASIPAYANAVGAVNSLRSDFVLTQAKDGDRPVDFFVGVALFANKNDLANPIDLYKGTPLFEKIPNKWWLDTGADPGYANSPDRDDDGDGFSNREEFEAHTNPKDPNDFPALIDKLVYVQDKSIRWYVKYGFDSGETWAPALVGNTFDNRKLANRVTDPMLKAGDTFFTKGDFKDRFKFTGITSREVTSERTHSVETRKIAQFEELKPNKKGVKYESEQGLVDAELDSHAYYDRSAVIELHANGQNGKQLVVEEGTKFALPFDAAEKSYLMKTITPNSIQVEYTGKDGSTKTLDLAKGTH